MATQAFNSSYTGAQLEEKVQRIDDLFNLIYPIGAVYISVSNISPQTLFGGTWEQIKDSFLLSAGSTYTAGNTGGSATHTPSGTVGGHSLVVAEMPAHAHTRGSMNITGWLTNYVLGCSLFIDIGCGGAIYRGGSNRNYYGGGSAAGNAQYGDTMYFDAARNWTGETSSVGSGASHSHGFTGTSQDTMPPYLVVYMWKRTA